MLKAVFVAFVLLKIANDVDSFGSSKHSDIYLFFLYSDLIKPTVAVSNTEELCRRLEGKISDLAEMGSHLQKENLGKNIINILFNMTS